MSTIHIHKAAKEYTCSKCGRVIHIGEKHKNLHIGISLKQSRYKKYNYIYCSDCIGTPRRPQGSVHYKEILKSAVEKGPVFLTEFKDVGASFNRGGINGAYKQLRREGLPIIKFAFGGSGAGVKRFNKNTQKRFVIYFLDKDSEKAWNKINAKYPNAYTKWRRIGTAVLNGKYPEIRKKSRETEKVLD